MKTGVIGLGAMGAAMARNLHRTGYLAAVWNRTMDKSRQLADELDVPVAVEPAALAQNCDLVILSVSADADVMEVIDTMLPGVSAGMVVVDTSTISRDTACEAAARLQKAKAEFLDAPVSGGMEGARNGSLAMMVGGEAEVLREVRPVLDSIAGRIEHMGPVGAGQAAKAVNQVMAAGINQAVSEALAFAAALELPLDRVIEVIGSGAAGNWFLAHRGPTMTRGNYEPGFRIALHHKDLAICKQMAAQFGVALPVVEMTLIHYRRLMEAGLGDLDISALHHEKQGLFAAAGKRQEHP
jgi:3-hydroxyisobutyrate dehydrogenase